jgi:sarcosine oxidase
LQSTYDVAVIGIGTMGSFACCELARRGVRVIGFDRFVPPHGRGSHSGDTRIFRTAYAEHPSYVPLALRSRELWDEYSLLSDTKLLTRTGMLSMGPPDGYLVSGILKSAKAHNLEVTQYRHDELRRAFPAFAPDESHIGVFESGAGWIDADLAIRTALRLAGLNGASLHVSEPIVGWTHTGTGFQIQTESDTVTVKKLVITAGAWSAKLLEGLGLPLHLERKVLTWIRPMDPALFQPNVCPVFAFDEGFLYGFPMVDQKGVKLAVHKTAGQRMLDPDRPVAEATLDEAKEPLEIAARLLPRLAGPLPQALQRVTRTKTCLYVMSHDEHFFVDRHPEIPDLFFAAGFSGHGFKFAPAIGEILADLVTTGSARSSIGFLSVARIAGRGKPAQFPFDNAET